MQPARKTAGELHRFYKHHRLAWMVLFFAPCPPRNSLTHSLTRLRACQPGETTTRMVGVMEPGLKLNQTRSATGETSTSFDSKKFCCGAADRFMLFQTCAALYDLVQTRQDHSNNHTRIRLRDHPNTAKHGRFSAQGAAREAKSCGFARTAEPSGRGKAKMRTRHRRDFHPEYYCVHSPRNKIQEVGEQLFSTSVPHLWKSTAGR